MLATLEECVEDSRLNSLSATMFCPLKLEREICYACYAGGMRRRLCEYCIRQSPYRLTEVTVLRSGIRDRDLSAIRLRSKAAAVHTFYVGT